MKADDALLDRPPEAAVRILALALLDEAGKASLRLSDEADEEALHDFRVALRRLRSLFKTYRELLSSSVPKKQARALRELAASTGAARDAEVQLKWLATTKEQLKPTAHAAWTWLAGKFEERRNSGYASIRAQAPGRFHSLQKKLRPSLSRYEATLGADGARSRFASALGEKVRAAGGELISALTAIGSVSDVEPAHAARIRGKRLRYLLEPLRKTSFEKPVEHFLHSMKKLQEVLGELHDVHVLADELAASTVQSATERAQRLHAALYSTQAAPPERDLRAGLLAIDRQVRDNVETLYQSLKEQWLGERLPPLAAELEELATALCRCGTRDQEIERKYLLSGLPVLEEAPLEIRQGWIPGKRLRERLRHVHTGEGGDHYYRTVKVGAGLQRLELEEETSREVFEQLWSLTLGHRVQKRRYRVPEGDRVWELDLFLDRELVVAELEVASVDEAVEVPLWLKPHLVREVTGDEAYSNEKLAL